jgi:hypothetical protein
MGEERGRDIRWEGFYHARDLGGPRTRDGRRTRHGALIRAADPRFVTREDTDRPLRTAHAR